MAGGNGNQGQVIDVVDASATYDRSGLSDRQRLLARVSEKLAAKGPHQLATVELRRLTGSGDRPSRAGAEVHTWLADESPELFVLRAADQLVSEIIAAAEENAYGFEGNRFCVCLVDKRQSVTTFVLRVESQEQIAGGTGDASNRAVISLLMTQNERLMQHCVKLSAGACEQMRLMTVQFGEHTRALMNERQQWTTEREKLLSKQYERETARLLAEGSEKRKDEAAKRLIGMSEEAFKHFKGWALGKSQADVKATAEAAKAKHDEGKALSPTELFSMLYSGLRSEQFSSVLEVFPDDKGAVFVPIIEKVAAKENQDEAICAFVRTLTLAEVTALRQILTDEQAKIFAAILTAAEGRKN